MERTTEVPRELTQVLQAIVIVFLAARLRFPRFVRRRDNKPAPQSPQSPQGELV